MRFWRPSALSLEIEIYPGTEIILEEREQENDAFVVKTEKAAWCLR